MTARKPSKAAKQKEPLKVTMQEGEDEAAALARIGLDPAANAMATARLFTRGSFGELSEGGLYQALGSHVAEAKGGDLSRQRAMLAAQSFTLNSIFTEMARRAALNMSEYVGAAETYMRLALKAQAQSRATIEALDRLVNGREQTVKHVHVDNRGGQAVIADTVQTGGEQNGRSNERCHATTAARGSSALLGTDPHCQGVPFPSCEGSKAVPHARRDEPWCSEGQH